jgi:hypothetical protein
VTEKNRQNSRPFYPLPYLMREWQSIAATATTLYRLVFEGGYYS